MARNEEELKARLMAEAEAAIDRLLAQRRSKGQHTLTEIEQMALKLRQEVGAKATGILVEAEREESGPRPKCEKCGQEMHNKGRKRRRVVTGSGEIDIERTYYYCEGCKRGVFPSG